MKKQIIFSSYDDLKNPTYAGGGAVAVHQVARRLAKKYHVTVITGTYPGAKNESKDGVTYLRVGASWLGPRLSQLIFQLILPSYARTLSYDVWFDNLTPPISLGLLPLLAKSPVIGLVHMLPGEDMRRKYKIPFDLIEHVTLKSYESFIVTSLAIQEKIKTSNIRAKLTVIPNGVDLPKIKRGVKPSHILYLGRIEVNQKGLDLLISAYQSVYKKLQLPLVIAGMGTKEECEKLQALVAKTELQEHIRLVGRVEGKVKAELITHAAAIIVPSRFETFSLVAIEAMAVGVPLITFDIEGLRWIPRGARFTAKEMTIKNLAEAVLAGTKNSESTKKITRIARKFVEPMNWDVCATHYHDMIKEILP